MRKDFKEYNDAINKSVGEQLHARRTEKGLSIRNVADGCNISKTNYHNYECGKVAMPINNIILICDYLGLNYILVIEKAREAGKQYFQG